MTMQNPINSKRTVYVGGIEETVGEELIRAAFLPFGDIVGVHLPVDTQQQKHRGFGFVEFELPEDASSAVDNMHNSEMMGRIISCSIAKPIVSSSSRGKPVWSDDFYIATDQEKAAKAAEEADDSVMESTVVVNARTNANTTPVPEGLAKCKGCAGFGVGLVKENGYCDHCSSNLK